LTSLLEQPASTDLSQVQRLAEVLRRSLSTGSLLQPWIKQTAASTLAGDVDAAHGRQPDTETKAQKSECLRRYVNLVLATSSSSHPSAAPGIAIEALDRPVVQATLQTLISDLGRLRKLLPDVLTRLGVEEVPSLTNGHVNAHLID